MKKDVKFYNLHLLCFVIIYMTISVNVATQISPQIDWKYKYIYAANENIGLDRTTGDLLIGMITTNSNESQKRRGFMSKTWLYSLAPYDFDYLYCLDEKIPYHSIPVNNKYRVRKNNDVDRAAKRLTLAEYFLNHTNFNWLWIMTEDVSIDLDRVKRFIKNLNKQYDTNEEVVVLGNAVGVQVCFLQGGVGSIFSRAAAEKFVEFGPTWVSKHVHKYDDVEMNAFLDYINKKPKDLDVGGFIGHLLNISTFGQPLPNCSKTKVSTACGPAYHPIDNLFGVHWSLPPYGQNFIDIFREYEGKKIMYYNYVWTHRLCIDDTK